MASVSISYWGQEKCQASLKGKGENDKKCTNPAYYQLGSSLVCGVHSCSKAAREQRVELPRHPRQHELRMEERHDHAMKCDQIALENKQNGRSGRVVLCKMRMMKNVGFLEGFVNVFPNFLHGNRADGYGMPSLSPKSIGPIHHPQPNLPVSLNLENFHQGNKVFPSEVDEKNEILPTFFETQRKMYADPVPHRHKMEAQSANGPNKNVPLFSVWCDKEGVLHRISYFESRQFYSVYYERSTLRNPDFLRLQKMIREGYNLRICGYDAYDPEGAGIEECYRDVSRPFGHELVLYCMLTEPEAEWPWRKYKTFEF